MHRPAWLAPPLCCRSLPVQWGEAADSLPSLRSVNLTNCSLVGSLPAWGAGLRSLESM